MKKRNLKSRTSILEQNFGAENQKGPNLEASNRIANPKIDPIEAFTSLFKDSPV